MDQEQIQQGKNAHGYQDRSFCCSFILCAHQADNVLGIGRKSQSPAPEHGEACHRRISAAEKPEHLPSLCHRLGTDMGNAMNLCSSPVQFAEASHSVHQGHAHHEETDPQNRQVQHIGPDDRPVSAEGGIDDKQIDQQDRDGKGNIKQLRGDHAEAFVLGNQIKDIDADENAAADKLQLLGAVSFPQHPGHRDGPGLIQISRGKTHEKGTGKPGNHRVKEHRQSVLVDTAGKAQNGNGRNPGSGKCSHAVRKSHPFIADKVVSRGIVPVETAFADEQHNQRIYGKICQIQRGFIHRLTPSDSYIVPGTFLHTLRCRSFRIPQSPRAFPSR